MPGHDRVWMLMLIYNSRHFQRPLPLWLWEFPSMAGLASPLHWPERTLVTREVVL